MLEISKKTDFIMKIIVGTKGVLLLFPMIVCLIYILCSVIPWFLMGVMMNSFLSLSYTWLFTVFWNTFSTYLPLIVMAYFSTGKSAWMMTTKNRSGMVLYTLFEYVDEIVIVLLAIMCYLSIDIVYKYIFVLPILGMCVSLILHCILCFNVRKETVIVKQNI